MESRTIRNLHFMKELVKLRLSHIMTFRLGFFSPFFIDATFFLIQIFAFEAIYGHVDSICGWGRGEMIIFVGTFSLVDALNMSLYFFGVLSIPEKVQTGELDLYLTKPVSPLLRITFEKVDPGSLPLLLFSIYLITCGVRESGARPAYSGWAGYLIMVLFMTVLYYDLELLLRSASFFMRSVDRLVKLENTVIELCLKIPGVAFYGVYKVIFYCILPYGVIATIPTQVLMGTLSLKGILFGAGLTILFTVLSLSFWRYGIRHYESTGS